MQGTDEFAELARSKVRDVKDFQPHAMYDSDGDCIEFIATPDSFYGMRIDDVLTVYCKHGSDEVVGGLLKGISHLIQRQIPGIASESEPIKIRFLLELTLWARPADQSNPTRYATYKRLIDIADESKAEADLCPG